MAYRGFTVCYQFNFVMLLARLRGLLSAASRDSKNNAAEILSKCGNLIYKITKIVRAL